MVNARKKVPKGWAGTTLAELGIWSSGGTPSRKHPEYYGGKIPWVKTGELADSIIMQIDEYITEQGLQNSSAKLFPRGTLLLAMYGATIGQLGILGREAATNQACAALLSKGLTSDLIPFIFYLLKYVRKDLKMIGQGGAQPNISQTIIKGFPVVLPPLNEQKRIVAKIEALQTHSQHAREALENIPDLVEQLRQSVLSAACSGDLTSDWIEKNPHVESAESFLKKIQKERKNRYEKEAEKAKLEGRKKPKKTYELKIYKDDEFVRGWAKAKLENLIYISGRIGWRGLKAEEYTEEGPLFLSVHSLNYGEEVDFRHALHISMERYEESPEIQLQENDILLAKDGAGIGKIGIVKKLDQLSTVNSSLLVIRSLEAFVPKFLFYFLSGPNLQNIAKQRITGSATPHLFQKDIKQFILSIPPIEEQHEIVRRVEALFKIADRIEARYQVVKENVEKLTQSILAKAFRGDLVPQDPNDEPVSMLLERIRKEKAREAEIQRTKPKRKIKKMKRKKDKQIDILVVLREADRNMTPEEVFKAGGFNEESVDVFYEQLRNAVESNHVREIRSGHWIELEVIEK